jgi:prepilin-type processing-associated H-X9-DG protein
LVCLGESGTGCGGAGVGNWGTTAGFCLAPYLKSTNIWRCPSDPTSTAVQTGSFLGGYYNVSYAYNLYYFGECHAGLPASQTMHWGCAAEMAPNPLQMSQIVSPSNIATFFGCWYLQSNNNDYILDVDTIWNWYQIEGFVGTPAVSTWTTGNKGHNSGGNVAFADGHAKWLSGTYITAQAVTESQAYFNGSYGGALRVAGGTSTLFHE